MGVKVVETALRDGHQSLFATRMTTDEVLLSLAILLNTLLHSLSFAIMLLSNLALFAIILSAF